MRASVPLDEPPPLPQPFLQKPLITNNKQENKGKMTSKSTDISKETIVSVLYLICIVIYQLFVDVIRSVECVQDIGLLSLLLSLDYYGFSLD